MKHTSALVVVVTLGAIGLSACGETLSPRSAAVSAAASAAEVTPGDFASAVAGMLGEPALGGRAAAAAAPASPLASLAASATSGRSVVVPNAYATMMGEANNVYPFSIPGMRYQQVFLGSELGGVRSVSGLCLRGDEVYGWGPSSTMQLTVKMG